MKSVLGVDVGGSTTKIVGFNEGKEMIGALQVRATDQITSMYGAIGHFLQEYGLLLKDVERIFLTGVGASYIPGRVYDIETIKVPEFQAVGLGGASLAGLQRALVISMGTGSAFIRVDGRETRHIGGSGVGGGTLFGLAQKLLDETDMEAIIRLSEEGSLANVDLSIQDISKEKIERLPPDLTAANFGNIKAAATEADFAAGLVNMVFQTIGMLAIFSCLDHPVKDVVLTGTLATLPQAKRVFEGLGQLHGLRFIIAPNAVFATAIGAAMANM